MTSDDAITPFERPNILRWIQRKAYEQALTDVGLGEEGANNAGRWLETVVRPNDGTGLPHDTSGAWCASWVSYRLMTARDAARAHFQIPDLRLPFKTSRGALRLGERMIEAGGVIVAPDDAQAGDTFFMKREGGGHTGWIAGPLYDGGTIPTLEGNVGKFPALVTVRARPVNALIWIVRLT